MPERINHVHPHQSLQSQQIKNKPKSQPNFKDVLTAAKQIKVSKHAEQRLIERNITINHDQWKLINEKLNEAKEKGVRDSLVLLKDAALVVNAKNNTVITALDRDEAASRIFTNINGTILINE